jgi:uncharacterized protein YndB with AHSA1/START domain
MNPQSRLAPIHDLDTVPLVDPSFSTANQPHPMIKKLLLGLVAIIVVFLVVAALQPSAFRVVRSATVAAPPAAVFEQINNLQNWNAWSPWAKLDPEAKNTFAGPPSGVGASFGWAGNSQVGEGKMTITESQPPERVVMRLEFVKPFAATSTTEFTLKPEGDKTSVTWSMAGQNNFVGKCMSLLMNCDKMVGGQFEQGFNNLRAIVEPKSKS